MNYRTLNDTVLDMVYYNYNYVPRIDDISVEVTYGMPFNDYMELTSELLSNNMVSPGPSNGFVIKQVRLASGVVVHLIKSESLALRMEGLEEGDEYYGPQAPVIQMQTLPNRA